MATTNTIPSDSTPTKALLAGEVEQVVRIDERRLDGADDGDEQAEGDDDAELLGEPATAAVPGRFREQPVGRLAHLGEAIRRSRSVGMLVEQQLVSLFHPPEFRNRFQKASSQSPSGGVKRPPRR